jgi:hypothetical protein
LRNLNEKVQFVCSLRQVIAHLPQFRCFNNYCSTTVFSA